MSVRLGSRSRSSGSSAAAAIRQNRPSPMARPTGGNHSHSPSQDSARNRPAAVAIDASAGQSRSHRIDQRARVSARSSIACPPSAGRGSSFGAAPGLSFKSNSSNENLRDF